MVISSKLNNSYITLFFFFSLISGFKAQTLEKLQEKYPFEKEVNLRLSRTINIAIEKDKLKITSENYEESILLKDDVNNSQSSGKVYFSSFQQLNKLDAYSLVPSGNKTKKLQALNFRIKPDKNSRSFHDDVKIKEFDFPQLGQGVKKITNYTVSYPDPHIIPGKLFLDRLPTELEELKVITDNAVELGYTTLNDPDKKVKFTKENKGSQTTYTWKSENVEKYSYENNAPTPYYYSPFVEIHVKKYQDKKGNTINVLNSLGDLHQLYRTFVKDIYKTRNTELEKTVDLIKTQYTNEYDQVKGIYYWVKDNIKYIAFEEGYGGFIPREASDVYNKRYGDCKDMSAIIYTMLNYAGIENVYLTWVGSREKPFSYYDFPTMTVDDHMIVTYQNKDKVYFLDATSKDTSFEKPTIFIQGKECLISFGTDKYEVIKVPIVPAEDNITDEKIDLTIQKNKLTGKGTTLYYGYSKNEVLNKLYDTRGVEMNNRLKELLEKGNNKFFLETHKIENNNNREKPLLIDYTFNIDNYITSLDNEIFINLFLKKITFDGTFNENRKRDYEIEYANTYKGKYILTIPQGYKVKYMPSNDRFDSDKFSYKINYAQNKNQLILDIEIKVEYLILGKNEFSQWNKFIAKLTDNYSKSISLSKK